MFNNFFKSKTQQNQNKPEKQQQKVNVTENSEEKPKHLPNQIYCNIIQLEMKLQEGKFDQEMLSQLLQLYVRAVQFYEDVGDQRYKLFQRKIQTFFLKNQVNAVLKGKNSQDMKIIKKEKVQEKLRNASVNNYAQVKKIINITEFKVERQKKDIQCQVKKQMQSLQKRLQSKRSRSLLAKNKMLSTNNLSKKNLNNLSKKNLNKSGMLLNISKTQNLKSKQQPIRT